MAGIDLGTVNIAAIVSTDHSSRVYKGGAVLSENRSFHKKKAEAASIITRGTRHRHGLYACSGGYRINADCSGAANILRKAFPGAWEGTQDFRFLAYPETAGWKELQRGRRA